MKQNIVLKHMRGAAQLTQGELADLLDVSQTRISRYESGEVDPSLNVVLAYYAVFGRPPHRMFTDMFASVEDGVMARGARLERSLRNKHDRASIRKRATLEKMMSRACSRAEA